jgi:hypothetical protein
VLEDRDKPAVAPGVYPGIFLGKGLMLNGIPMVAVIRRVGAAIAGWKYIGDLTSIYRANQEYRWNAPDDAVGVIGDSINTPDDLNVISPRGGTVHTRNDDLVIRWTGGGSISIIIQSRLLSTANVAKTRPLLLITPNINRGRLTLNPKILALLPKGKDFVFTFVLANRKEVKVPRYSGKVLLQAASIYNSYVVIN